MSAVPASRDTRRHASYLSKRSNRLSQLPASSGTSQAQPWGTDGVPSCEHAGLKLGLVQMRLRNPSLLRQLHGVPQRQPGQAVASPKAEPSQASSLKATVRAR